MRRHIGFGGRMGLAEAAGMPFVQEVFATAEVVRRKQPDASCAIELGGEDAKDHLLRPAASDERMNGTCAGGTGAFIDQMATLLGRQRGASWTGSALTRTRIYPIASRCGVFAKTDIQPLLNQGARKEDIAASIYQAVVNQTIAGLAQGRAHRRAQSCSWADRCTFCNGLRARFRRDARSLTRSTRYSRNMRGYSVAMGAAMYAATERQRRFRSTR